VTDAFEASIKEEETLAEKAALITGGSSGIGLAIARMLGEDGYGITVSARRPEKLEAAAEDLRSGGLDDVQSVVRRTWPTRRT
jgi:NAD(P)-dependent dehydrogenase (short-subunit alcohol dehydrogenase family)